MSAKDSGNGRDLADAHYAVGDVFSDAQAPDKALPHFHRMLSVRCGLAR